MCHKLLKTLPYSTLLVEIRWVFFHMYSNTQTCMIQKKRYHIFNKHSKIMHTSPFYATHFLTTLCLSNRIGMVNHAVPK